VSSEFSGGDEIIQILACGLSQIKSLFSQVRSSIDVCHLLRHQVAPEQFETMTAPSYLPKWAVEYFSTHRPVRHSRQASKSSASRSLSEKKYSTVQYIPGKSINDKKLGDLLDRKFDEYQLDVRAHDSVQQCIFPLTVIVAIQQL
jgi:hypothetical protein